MTPLQSACLQAIQDMTVANVPPTFEMLRIRLNLASRSNVHRLIEALKAQGRVESEPGMYRSLRVVEPKPDLSKMSLAGLRDHIANAQAELDARLQGRGRG